MTLVSPILRTRCWYIKLTNWEYWPSWTFYVPVWIQHFWLSIKVKNLFFFLATNPVIDGFILSDSKFKTLQMVPDKYRPKSIYVDSGSTQGQVLEWMQKKAIGFPVVLKPDIGFRGIKVSRVDNEIMLRDTLTEMRVPHILQEYIAHPLELGIFYYRYPNEDRGNIPSITIKEFLSVEGTGRDTLKELVFQNPRAILQKEKIKNQFNTFWDVVLAKGEKLKLEAIGNHNLGTKFRNGNHLLDDKLLEVFDELSFKMNGFYFGRFDIKANSLEDIKLKKEFKILEVNGVGGEPTHIYDPDHSFVDACSDLCFIWRVAAKIACLNFKEGIRKPTYQHARRKWLLYTAYKSKLLA